jgi:acyl carrier protein
MELVEIQDRVESFVREQFHVAQDDPRFDRATDLYEGGYIDSVGVVELLAFIAETFGVTVPEAELLSPDFSSIEGIGAVVHRLR